ncbi:MAG TPA: DUF3800 domain-containing protein [Acidobacteriota bacterium]|nr:DUF3800 domain-containing protein [Acidobacteriota bacterium]
MYLMYVDESGDSGMTNSPTRHFVLSGLVVHELRWQACLEQLIEFRRRMKAQFGVRLREEIHAARFITHPGDMIRIKRNDRLTIIRMLAREIASMTDLNIINVAVDKLGKTAAYDIFEMAWKALIQRFENTANHRNFRGPANPDERGMLFPDNTENKKITDLLRRMRRYNPIPNQPFFGPGYRNIGISKIIEDPSFRDSSHSYFIQAADLVAFLLYQYLAPSAYFRKKGATGYFKVLDPVLCKVASQADPYGIVRL